MQQRWVWAAAALVIEYLLFSVLFDAIELVPAGLLSIGDLAPMPLIVGVAFFILRTSADADAPPAANGSAPKQAARSRGALLLVSHLLAYAAFLAASFHLRALVADGSAPLLAASVVWSALGVGSLALLLLFAFHEGFLDLARRAAGPVLLGSVVGVAAWFAGQHAKDLWTPLARWTLRPVAAIVGALSPDLVSDVEQRQVGTARFFVTVDPVCSGYEGMGLVAVLLGAYLWSFRRTLRFPHALLLPVLAIAAAFWTNVVRITSLIYVGTFGNEDVAMGGFHSKAGWLMFCGVALATTYVARHAPFFQRDRSARDAEDNPTAGYLVPLLALVAGALVTGLASDGGLDRLELLRLGAAVVALWLLRRTWRAALPPLTSSRWLGFAGGVVVFVLWMALAPGGVEAADADAAVRAQLDALPASLIALWIIGRLLGSVVIAPLVEELAFRGFLLRRLIAVDFTAVSYRHASALAVVVSSVAFGALHERWFAGALAGVVYAGVAWRSGRLTDAVIAHVVTNGLIAVVVLAAGRWSLWG